MGREKWNFLSSRFWFECRTKKIQLSLILDGFIMDTVGEKEGEKFRGQ